MSALQSQILHDETVDIIKDNETEEITSEVETKVTIGTLLGERNFRLLWLGETISILGDQFSIIAMPWLVLQLTGSALAMGTVFALQGIPRAILMLFGGALSDRFSPRNVMLISNIVRMALVSITTVLILGDVIELWMIYLIALMFGVGDAFFYPAQMAIVPQVSPKNGLQLANSFVQGTAQISVFLGPVIAGGLIALFSRGNEANITGIGVAFALDALTFLVSAWSLYLIQMPQASNKSSDEDVEDNVLKAIRDGLSFVWNDPLLRGYFILIAVSNVLINGPFMVGVPAIADARLTEGAAAFGIMMSGFGGGYLGGIILAGILPKPRQELLGSVLMVIWSSLGLSILLFGFVESIVVGTLLTVLLGLGNGYVVILFITWLQERTPEVLLGRMMSLLMFASAGLIPLSTAVTGALIEINITATFVASGGLMTTLVLLAAILYPRLRHMDSYQPRVNPEIPSQ